MSDTPMRKVPVLATVVVIAAVFTMIGLGIWQLGRLEEKEAMIARFEAAADNPAMLAAFPEEDPEANLYRRTPYECFHPGRWSAIAGRNSSDQAGYVHIAECWDSERRISADVVVGWSRSPTAPVWEGGALTGMIAPGGEAGWRVVADPPLAGLQANATPDPNDTPNNHLAYAFQWFFFALTALVIYALALRRRWRDRSAA